MAHPGANNHNHNRNTNSNANNNSAACYTQLEVSKRQKGNHLLRYISNKTWRFNDANKCDYVMGPKIGALYLSLRYHKMNNAYIHGRISQLRNTFACRILVLHIDDGDNYNDDILIELNKICCINRLILICAWSYMECARYIESYMEYRNRSPDCLMSSSYKQYVNSKRNKQNQLTEKELKRDDMVDVLSQVKSVTAANVSTAMNEFGTIAALSKCSKEQLTALPGFGNKKARFLFNVFNKPFKTL